MDEVYHNGEREIQAKVGEEMQANSNSRVITGSIIKGAINFIEKQPMAIVSSVDIASNVWASLLIGDYGFVTVPTPNGLSINKDFIYSNKDDIFFENIVSNNQIGTLFIEFHTRRRFRINGVASRTDTHINVAVLEAYPNCPKYIQQRVISTPTYFEGIEATKTFGNSKLSANLKEWIMSSDTFFVGSQSSNQKMDVSHRGGKPGFVEVLDDRTLKIPDYRGNSMYNTLGNFVENPKAGLLFVDFGQQKTMQLTGTVELLFDHVTDQDLVQTGGTGRYWLFKVGKWILTSNHHQVNWELMAYSPFNP